MTFTANGKNETFAFCLQHCVQGCQSFCLQVDSPISRSFRLHGQVVSPTRFESIRLHKSHFAYTYKSKYFVKIGENHCPQLTKDS